MKTVTVRQVLIFKASPQKIYQALLDSRQHSRIIGMKASISRKVGGAFSLFDGGITGTNLALEPNRRIVQSWRAGDWPQGYFSRVVFTLTRIKSGTRLTLTHSGVPARDSRGISRGWREYYWDPMRSLLEK